MLANPRVVTDPADCTFYHTMDIPGFGLQTGQWDLRGRFDEYIGNIDLRGKSVLDVGCASGFLSFSAETAGASEVFSFDMDSPIRQHKLPFKNGLYFSNYEEWVKQQGNWVETWKNAYWLAHSRLNSRAKVFYGDVYDISREHGQFDVTIVGSILEHLSDPIRALASISKVSRATIAITTPALHTEDPIARFVGDRNKPTVDFVFWVYSIGIYRHVLGMLGFEIDQVKRPSFFCNIHNKHIEVTTIVAHRV
jgi:SAM-dependent methyltransferase